ncbi:MAG: type VI secretion system baseplate subunit TssG [Deltaproteobacteria bacterium]|nr:type VI secretion system baseplate subunit TssG [Deltaproteobacteria bacterium]
MAGQDWTSTPAIALGEALAREPYRFDFFQALRRLDCAHPARPRLGAAARPADEPVRLTEAPSMAFAASTLASFERATAERPARLAVLFFGLFGPNGPLPLHLTEYARDRLRNSGDATFVRFADTFHHRLLAFFYRAWANARPTVHFDRPDADRFAAYVGALFGLALPSLRHRDALPDLAKLYYAGRLGSPARGAEGLKALLQDFFRMPVDVEQFVGHWLELPEESRCRLGESPDTGTLGSTAIAGSRIWSCQDKFRIVMGPLHLDEYRRLLPGGDSLARLVSLVRNYVGDEFCWDMNLVLHRDEVPPLTLGGETRLGFTAWCTSRRPDEHAHDLTLDPLAAAS